MLGAIAYIMVWNLQNPEIYQSAKEVIGKRLVEVIERLGKPDKTVTREQIDQGQVDFPVSTYSSPPELPSKTVLVYRAPNALVYIYFDHDDVAYRVYKVHS
jgi:hypothetical protein